MNRHELNLVAQAKRTSISVLLHNAHGPYRGLPRTAAWGYPEPYTRDLLISSLGILVSGHKKLIESLRRVLKTLAKNQSRLGHIPSLVHDKEDRGASDTTPLFIMTTALFRQATGEDDFLAEAVQKAVTWMEYQCPSDSYLVGQLPTSDWRDEQWVLGYGLFVNTVTYTYLKFLGCDEYAARFKESMGHFTIKGEIKPGRVHEGLVLKYKPYYALWSYKIYKSERFDLLGNSLAILSGLASPTRAQHIIGWVESECDLLKQQQELGVDVTPNLFPYIKHEDPDWRPRYEKYNLPGEYHNGGIWPFVCGFYIAALVAAKRYKLAEKKLVALTKLIHFSREADVNFGFNEWYRAQDGTPQGQDWQTWSASMYLYAVNCVEQKRTPFFELIQEDSKNSAN